MRQRSVVNIISLLSANQIDDLVNLATSAPPGAFAEVGVYKGGSAWFLAEVARKQQRNLHLFDTFTGIPEQDSLDYPIKLGDFADTSFEAVQKFIPDAIFHVGMFPDTLPSDLEPLAFVHVDCDQYHTCREVIRLLVPLLVPNGIMLFDDYKLTTGVTRAVDESFGRNWQLTGNGKPYVRKSINV
jgi:O-methyltransferase